MRSLDFHPVLRGLRCGAGLLLLLGVNLAAAAEPWPFFAFDNGVGRDEDLPPDEQAKLLAELGYDGIGYTGVKNLAPLLEALDRRDLKLFSVYVKVDLNPGQTAYDAELPLAIEKLRGRGTVIWLNLHGERSPSTAQDDRAVELIREIADLAQAVGLRVALYPHAGIYVATTRDAVRVAEKVDRENVGVSFNLCHFLQQSDERHLAACLQLAMPRLFLVSINGADGADEANGVDTRAMKWDRLIQPLDQGTFDNRRLVKLLREGGYDGPIGLQSYALKGDRRENLRRSVEAWKKMKGSLSGAKGKTPFEAE